MNWSMLAVVMAGGALGAAIRFALGSWLLRQADGFPWSTLAVNLAGSFAVGFAFAWLENRHGALHWRAFLIVGVLGAMTTYSALMLECLLLGRAGRSGMLLVYLGLSLVLGLALVWAGARTGGLLRP